MTQGFNPYQRLQELSNAVGALNQKVVQVQAAYDALKSVNISPVNSSVPGDFKARRAFAKAWGGAGYVSIDQIKGRFVPYDEFVEIPIADGNASAIESVLKVSMEGPFVASRRYAVFQSKVTYQVTFADNSTATFKGRTNGRFRGVTSSTDVADAIRAFDQISQYQPSYVGAVYDGTDIFAVANPAGVNPNSTDTSNMLPNFPGTGRPLVVSPLSMSGGRSMTFDGTIAVTPQGAQFNRQNIPIPSSLWTDGFNGPVDLACYDVLEPGEEVIVRVNPLHVNNPAFGNISSLVALNEDYTFSNATGAAANDPLPAGAWPFLLGQFDGHEGINDETLYGDADVTVDRVSRVFDGSLFVGYMGFRIIAPPGGG